METIRLRSTAPRGTRLLLSVPRPRRTQPRTQPQPSLCSQGFAQHAAAQRPHLPPLPQLCASRPSLSCPGPVLQPGWHCPAGTAQVPLPRWHCSGGTAPVPLLRWQLQVPGQPVLPHQLSSHHSPVSASELLSSAKQKMLTGYNYGNPIFKQSQGMMPQSVLVSLPPSFTYPKLLFILPPLLSPSYAASPTVLYNHHGIEDDTAACCPTADKPPSAHATHHTKLLGAETPVPSTETPSCCCYTSNKLS